MNLWNKKYLLSIGIIIVIALIIFSCNSVREQTLSGTYIDPYSAGMRYVCFIPSGKTFYYTDIQKSYYFTGAYEQLDRKRFQLTCIREQSAFLDQEININEETFSLNIDGFYYLFKKSMESPLISKEEYQ